MQVPPPLPSLRRQRRAVGMVPRRLGSRTPRDKCPPPRFEHKKFIVNQRETNEAPGRKGGPVHHLIHRGTVHFQVGHFGGRRHPLRDGAVH